MLAYEAPFAKLALQALQADCANDDGQGNLRIVFDELATSSEM